MDNAALNISRPHPPEGRGSLASGAGSWTTSSNVVLDETDIRILAQLQRDGRISKTALAEMVGLSTSACLERMRRLEKKKIILSYHAHVNLKISSGCTASTRPLSCAHTDRMILACLSNTFRRSMRSSNAMPLAGASITC